MMDGSQAEKDAKASGDWEGMREAFTEFQNEFHATSNDAKNASLYVDWKDGEFVSPSERITDEMLAQIIERNQAFLGYAQNGLSMLKRLDKSPEDLQGLVVDFIDSAKKLRGEMPDDPVTAGNQLVRQFMDAGLKKLELWLILGDAA
ncbi:AbiV family abortive infection protein [Bradyrhizobium diazoefficiens]|uniref:AbiV family abortive infection protein n=1 Tax=Bradyrhizobium diazoefficiens TaxID=1355477 RepID=UPI00272CE2E4|nr:AbiV family abortive infection protein [Bradyrhizobium diazoefficiens]WLA64120.1 AbiV family abortive infection protein [Bradyrhizobium diazoefficiens]